MPISCSLRNYLGSGSLLVKGVREFAIAPSGRQVLGRVKDTQPEQVETGTAVHLALDQLESVNLPLHHPVAPGQLQCGGDGILVAPEAASKGSIGGAFRSFEPPRPRCRIPLADDVE